jgi:cytosine/adenosine deaminase-related metal-dependent hydrolase
MRSLLLFLLSWLLVFNVLGQETFPRNGVKDEREKIYAFTHATIFIDYQTMISDATLIIRHGRVEAVGKNLAIPKDAITTDLSGKYIYPSFIDMYSGYGVPVKKRENNPPRGPQFLSDKSGAYSWNEAVHPEMHANELFSVNKETAKQLRELGFGTVSTHQEDGIARGTGAMVLLGEEEEGEMLIKNQSAAYYSFDKELRRRIIHHR